MKSIILEKHIKTFFRIWSSNKYVYRCACTKVDDILQKTDRLRYHDTDSETKKMYKSIMTKVPQPVVVVTSGYHELGQWHKRGVTCTSFTSVSFQPPIVSICLQIHSRMHTILEKSQHFAVHVLARHQVSYGMNFARYTSPDSCQFQNIAHYQGPQNVPVILGCCAVLECRAQSVHTVGDHNVWYGEVQDAHIDDNVSHPMLYQSRSFRSIGDEIFLQSFEDATLPFENWTHEAHLRMAWNYIREHGRAGAEPFVKSGIKKFNEKNKDKIKTGYSETITMFYMFLIDHALTTSPGPVSDSFESFLKSNGHLLDRSLMYEYYSPDVIKDPASKERFILPDKKQLPGM